MKRLILAAVAAAVAVPRPHAQAPQADVRIVRPNAVIHSVADLNVSEKFYREVVGLLPDASPPPEIPAAGSHRAAILRVPGGDVRLILVQFSGVDAKPVRPRLQDPGNVKTVMRVRDMDAAFARVRPAVAGVFTEGGGPIHPEGPSGFNRAVIMRDPDGFPLEFAYQQGPIAADVPESSLVVGGWATLIVEDAVATLAFYRDRLGFRPTGVPSPLAEGVLSLQGLPSAKGSMSVGVKPPGAAATWRMYDYRNVERTRLPGRLQDPGTAAVSFWAEKAGTLRDPNGLLIQLLEAR